MNDRFKFRCFNRKTKKMYEVDSLHLDSENEWVWVHYYNPIYDKDLKIQIEHPKCILMQSTGLKDKNGKLIYEGDILQQPQFPHKVVCEWYKDGFWLNGFMNGAKRELRNMHNWYEVIGNIYENADLLEDTECQK